MSPAWRFCIALAAVTVLFSCASQPKTGPAPQNQPDSSQQTVAPGEGAHEEFIVTRELYNRTFDEVKQVIADLTALISARDYDGWRSYLTADYIARTSNPDFLATASHSGVLQKSGIVLRSLKDYFQNVVVSSRVQASLDDINFVDANHVKALTIIDGRPVILYYLVREDGRWKVGIWPTEQR
jgi:hypothetical protein